jgi:hypothetical protein
MKVNSQFHAPTVLPLEESPRYVLDRGSMDARAGLDAVANKKSLFVVPGLEHCFTTQAVAGSNASDLYSEGSYFKFRPRNRLS